MVGLDAVLRSVYISFQLRVAQAAQRVDAADQLVELEDCPPFRVRRSIGAQLSDERALRHLFQTQGDKERFNRGFEVPIEFCHEDKDYQLRMIILFDHGLCAIKQKTLQSRVDKTRDDFQELSGKLNRYKLKSQEQIDAACTAILKKNNTESYFTYLLTNNPVTTYKNGKRGRPSANSDKIAEVNDQFSVQLDFDESAFAKAQSQCGYYPLLTNKPSDQLSIEEAMLAHKNQYKCEHTFRRAKGPYSIEPIYLHTPERIESFLFLFKIALQILVLIERTARKNIDDRDRGLDGFMPNRKDVRNPRSEFMLKEFEDIV